MTDQQMELIREAGELYADLDPTKHRALAERVLAVKLSPEETLAMSDALGKAVREAPDELAKADATWNRALFRAWMRVQAAAEQGHMFEPPPRQKSVKLAENGE